MKKQQIDIVLPSRIGDSILSIPAAVCLEQLSQKYANYHGIRVMAKPFLVDMFNSLELLNFRGMNFAQKLRSHFFPANKVFFVETTNDNFGYKAKDCYGIENEFKKFLKFTHKPVYLRFSARPFPQTWEIIKNSFPRELVEFLLEECKLPWYSVCLFGVCLDVGYSAEQIIDTFRWSQDLINLDKISYNLNEKYAVFCVEAGYGRKHLDERCWDISGYFEIAKKCAEDFGLKSVFVGVNRKMPLPKEDYIVDLRGKINIKELAGVMKSAQLYIGNDTGPAHLANLMKTRSVSVYMKEETMKGFSPVFIELNTQLLCPEGVEPIYDEVVKILSQATQKSLSAQNSA